MIAMNFIPFNCQIKLHNLLIISRSKSILWLGRSVFFWLLENIQSLNIDEYYLLMMSEFFFASCSSLRTVNQFRPPFFSHHHLNYPLIYTHSQNGVHTHTLECIIIYVYYTLYILFQWNTYTQCVLHIQNLTYTIMVSVEFRIFSINEIVEYLCMM